MENINVVFKFIVVAWFLASCETETGYDAPDRLHQRIPENPAEAFLEEEHVHPQIDRIPHYDEEAITIAPEFREVDFPVSVHMLRDFLHNTDEFSYQALPAELASAHGMDTEEFGDRLIVLHIADNQLLEINRETGDYRRIAEQGSGPGDIAHPYGLTRSDEHLYVIGQDMRISVFDCSQWPCEFEEEIPLEYSGLGGTVFNEHIAVLSHTPLAPGGEVELNDEAIFIYNYDGEVDAAFAPAYDTDFWLVLDMYLQGDVLYEASSEKFLVFYQHLPFLYVYNREFELDKKYHIPSFKQSRVRYDTDRHSRSVDINSLLLRITPLSGHGDYLLTVSHRLEAEADDAEYRTEFDYYYLNTGRQESSYIGSYKTGEDFHTDIQLLTDGILINEGGILKVVQPVAD